MNSSTLVIIGAGATTVSLLDSLVDRLDMAIKAQVTIYVLEKRAYRGRGLAYDVDLPSNLLNTRAGYITPFSDKPGHFFDWIINNRLAWEDDFPGLEVKADTFVPRPLFGLYLEHMMSDLSARLARVGARLVPVRAEATDIRRTQDGDLLVTTDASLVIRADQVVLSLGNLQSAELSDLTGRPGFFSSPYPLRRVVRAVPRDAHIGILGARLSAIDGVVALKANGHEGPMTMISRSGYLPSVRGTQGRYQPQILTLDRLEAHARAKGHITLDDMLNWVCDEIRLAGGARDFGVGMPPAPPSDPLAFYEAEIAAARHPRPWQAVLYSTNTLIDRAWHLLDPDDKGRFLDVFQAAWMSYRVSIPVENAERLRDLMKAGQLSIKRGATRVTAREPAGYDVTITAPSGSTTVAMDAVMGAFGSPRDPAKLDSSLVRHLLKSGLARAHPHGGIDQDTATGQVLDARGRAHADLHVLGELTSGVNFFTSVLEINARHAARAAGLIAQSLVIGSAEARAEAARLRRTA